MRLTLTRPATAAVALILAGCAPAASVVPSSPGTEPSAVVVPPGEVSFAPGPSAGSSVEPSGPATSSPSTASVSLPVRGSAREISSHDVLMAPGPDRGLYVVIPSRTDSTLLVLFDAAGAVRSGWPVHLTDVESCQQVMPVDDGSVRVVCTRPNPGNAYSDLAAFAFGADGRALGGWPVDPKATFVTGRVVGDDLALLAWFPLGDVTDPQPSAEVAVVTIGRDGAMTTGARRPMTLGCCDVTWAAVGPDGTGYGVDYPDGSTGSTRLSAVGPSGSIAGWPISIGGMGVAPAFGPGGRIVMAVGSSASETTRVVVVDRAGAKHPSSHLPLRSFEVSGDTGGCTIYRPRSPLVAEDGTTFVYSELDDSIYSLDTSLEVKDGWPFEPATSLEIARPGLESEHEAGYCPTPVVPGIGPDSTLYLALKARTSGGSGSLVAVGPNARVRSGWPVTLSRPGAQFWSVVVGSDGTAYALAIEPESGGRSSASILAIAPDSAIRWTTTIVDP